MNSVVKIGNHPITVKEYKGQRAVTFKDIDLVHERPDGTAGRNFRENKHRFIEGEDYFQRNSSEAKREFGVTAPNGLILLTEQGYLMLVKSFTDDLAWEVQRQLVNTYFKVKQPLSYLETLELQLKALMEVNEKVEIVDRDLQTFKQELPILGIECDRITAAVRAIGVNCLGGKSSRAYRDKPLRSRVYSDIYNQLKREFAIETYKEIKRSQCDTAVEIIKAYRLPLVIKEEIESINDQRDIA